MEAEASRTPLGKYFIAVDDGDVDAALELFAPTCIYARPSLPSPDRPDLVHFETLIGKEAVRAFLTERGTIPLVHEIHTTMIEKNRCFVEGTASFTEPDIGNDTLFMAHADLDEDGRISRFLAISTVIDAAARQIVVPSG